MDQATEYAARVMGATPADIPGLWNVPGLPELTTGQLLGLAAEKVAPLPRVGDGAYFGRRPDGEFFFTGV